VDPFKLMKVDCSEPSAKMRRPMPQFTIQQAIELALARQRAGDAAEAESIYRQIIAHQPDQPDALHLLGVMKFSQGDANAGCELIQRAVAAAPQVAVFHNNLGVVFKLLGDNAAAEEQFRAAIALNPSYAEALNNLGAIVGERGALTEAIELNRRAADLLANYGDTYANLGNALMRLGRIEEAVTALKKGIEVQPDLATANSNLLLTLNYSTTASPREVFDAHIKWGRRLCEIGGPISPHANVPDPERRLRVGYVSQDFRAHSVCYFILPALRHHDRQAVELFCYADVAKPDAMTELARQHADHWRPITGLPPARLAEIIRADAIDILIDLGGHTAPGLLPAFAMKPAPVQATYLGYPNTTGLDRIDYRITDSLADPPGDADHMNSERLLRLDPCAWCYSPPADAPPVAPRSHGPITFGSFNTIAKVNDALIATWAKVLDATVGSRLFLKAGALTEEATRQRMRDAFAKHGMDPARLDLAGQISEPANHLATYRRIDVGLDTFPYHGTTTTCEALWMGVPVVTRARDTHASRVGVSLLSNIGLNDLIAADEQDYVRIATGLAADGPRRAELRATMRQRLEASVLRDERSFAQRLEIAYRTMWRGWCETIG
jgi:predicted O-linked N-acetylglucosamine transferase (SPINDLY family)